jgi:hypothetical protein
MANKTKKSNTNKIGLKLRDIEKLSKEIMDIRNRIIHPYLDETKETNIEVVAYADAAQVSLSNAKLFLDKIYTSLMDEMMP